MIPNDVRLITNLNNQLDTDYVMVKNEAIPAVANTLKQLHIQNDMHMIYNKDFYKNKDKEIHESFIEYLVNNLVDLDHPVLIEERKQDIDADAYEKNLYKDVKLPSIKKN